MESYICVSNVFGCFRKYILCHIGYGIVYLRFECIRIYIWSLCDIFVIYITPCWLWDRIFAFRMHQNIYLCVFENIYYAISLFPLLRLCPSVAVVWIFPLWWQDFVIATTAYPIVEHISQYNLGYIVISLVVVWLYHCDNYISRRRIYSNISKPQSCVKEYNSGCRVRTEGEIWLNIISGFRQIIIPGFGWNIILAHMYENKWAKFNVEN
jgi:hypothetical protein